MTKVVNRRRKLMIRTRVSRREKEQLLARRRACGARTWRDFMFEISAARAQSSVDLSQVAQLSAVVVALSETPRLMRLLSGRLTEVVGEFSRIMLLNPDRADLHRLAIQSVISDTQSLVREVRIAAELVDLSGEPARREIVRVLSAIARS